MSRENETIYESLKFEKLKKKQQQQQKSNNDE